MLANSEYSTCRYFNSGNLRNPLKIVANIRADLKINASADIFNLIIFYDEGQHTNQRTIRFSYQWTTYRQNYAFEWFSIHFFPKMCEIFQKNIPESPLYDV